MCGSDCFLAILAVLFPPIAVWVKRGVCSADSLINIALLCLGYLPGLLHAWYIIAKYPDPYSYNYESLEGGNQRVYYYTATYPSTAAHTHPSYSTQRGQHHHHHHHSTDQQPRPQSQIGPQNYGTTSAPAPVRTETNAVEPSKPSSPPQNQLVVADGMNSNAGEGSSSGPSQPPPSYSDVVKGDFKVQTD